jgi:hypothetical protein
VQRVSRTNQEENRPIVLFGVEQHPGARHTYTGGVIPNKLTFNFFNGAPYPDFYNDGSQHNKHDNQDRALCVRSSQN